MPQYSRPSLDEVDRELVDRLRADGRVTNAALAKAVGIAESTCTARVRRLRERGVITGFHAEVDPAMVGRPVEALVAVRFAGQQRQEFERLRAELLEVPGVLALFHLSGSTDYLVQVAAPTTDALRDFVLDHLTSNAGVAHAETSLVFDRARGAARLAQG